MRYYRDCDGRFSKRGMALTILIIVGGFAICFNSLVNYLPESKFKRDVTKLAVVDTSSDKFHDRIREAKQDILDNLSLGCETKGLAEPDAAIILDSNNKMSMGRFMFQRETVQFFVEKFEGRKITRREAIEIAIDPIRASALAEKILFEEIDGWKHWSNCALMLGLPNEIAMLNKLSR